MDTFNGFDNGKRVYLQLNVAVYMAIAFAKLVDQSIAQDCTALGETCNMCQLH
eukprot:SAG31_NODE_19112_length_612_cov_0.582846_1_plen_52_part_10